MNYHEKTEKIVINKFKSIKKVSQHLLRDLHHCGR